ncbi:FAD-dependent thymidylate synthase [Fibrisoma montanum]|uniref:FAD-dependent thymidylate synthase n=1 Tax=Fibrisoma montanum TaxID=2305895 RepID=A0A418MB94_9BACT|nr:FAD-dependent thymidylate synthase [Fibrisoma montanum]RIV23638.1 FAD-dependent thymidylate synthase [Fibrisoma montanum]
MNVKLISITQSLIEEKQLSAEDLIVYTARVSNPSNQLNTETSDKLIAYLIRNKHWSPFEMVDMTVEIVTSRAIAAQILRHRSFSFQEFSQRYAEVTQMEPVQIRKQADKNRQSSTEEFDPVLTIDSGNDFVSDVASMAIEDHLQYSQNLYKSLLQAGVAKEVARMVLPLTTQTTIYMKGSVRSWIHYLQIRCDEHTQAEHRQVACAILDCFKTQFPSISKALEL